MNRNILNHDQFNTWQKCKKRYYFKYIKKLNWPELQSDFELGRSVHALIDYYFRGFDVEPLLKNANDDILDCWNTIKAHPVLSYKPIATEWAFNSKIKGSKFWLGGRIDAILHNEGKYIIADWKTGAYTPKNIYNNFQHKIYLYALNNCHKDLGLDISPKDIIFQYYKISDKVEITTIEYSEDVEKEYEKLFLSFIKQMEISKIYPIPDNCPIPNCQYRRICN